MTLVFFLFGGEFGWVERWVDDLEACCEWSGELGVACTKLGILKGKGIHRQIFLLGIALHYLYLHLVSLLMSASSIEADGEIGY
jgi:hypothetical protein